MLNSNVKDKQLLQESSLKKLAVLKNRIVEVEQKILLADKSIQYFVDGISSSYVQAINCLNEELVSFRKHDGSWVIRFSQGIYWNTECAS